MRLIETHTHRKNNSFSREKKKTTTELNSEQISVRDLNTTVTYRDSAQTDWLVGQT